MKICFVGTGYVETRYRDMLRRKGNNVCCVDIDKKDRRHQARNNTDLSRDLRNWSEKIWMRTALRHADIKEGLKNAQLAS